MDFLGDAQEGCYDDDEDCLDSINDDEAMSDGEALSGEDDDVISEGYGSDMDRDTGEA